MCGWRPCGSPDSEAVRETLLAMPRAERNACFLAFRGAEPAGVAIASAEGGVAQFRLGGPAWVDSAGPGELARPRGAH